MAGSSRKLQSKQSAPKPPNVLLGQFRAAAAKLRAVSRRARRSAVVGPSGNSGRHSLPSFWSATYLDVSASALASSSTRAGSSRQVDITILDALSAPTLLTAENQHVNVGGLDPPLLAGALGNG